MTLQVMVTRPAQQADSLCGLIESLGHQVLRHPMLRIEAEPETAHIRQRFLDIDHYHAVIAISRNAAEMGLAYCDQFWPQPPLGIHWLAVGPVTAQVMAPHLADVRMPLERFDSEGLLALECLQTEAIAHKKILVWRGVGGRETLAGVLRERGAQVDYAELYKRIVPLYTAEQWGAALASKPLLMVSSGQGLSAIAAQMPTIGQTVSGIIAPSHRVAQLAQSLGFTSIETSVSAQDSDMIAALNTWQSKYSSSQL